MLDRCELDSFGMSLMGKLLVGVYENKRKKEKKGGNRKERKKMNKNK